MTFSDRSKFIIGGTGDGGIDAYFIDEQQKKIFIIQSKFRNTEENFLEKKIDVNELAAIQLNRITKGEKFDQSGTKYNGKIEQLQREINNIQDIGRYDYNVIDIIGNNF